MTDEEIRTDNTETLKNAMERIAELEKENAELRNKLEGVKNYLAYSIPHGLINRRLNKKKTKWHDLRKNPDDLPPIEIGCCTIDVLTDSGRFAYYHHDNNCWVDSNGVDEIDTPKAWCEIPKFEEGK